MFPRVEFDAAAILKEADRQTRQVLIGVRAGVVETTRGLEQDLEKITQLAVPGRLYKGWQSQAIKKIAREPFGIVFFSGGSRSQGAITYWSQPGRLTAEDGGWLAIPLPAAGSLGRKRDLSPEEWKRRNGAELRFVYRPGRASLLVLDHARLSGKRQVGGLDKRGIKAGRESRLTVPIFVLIPFQDFANAFSVEPVIERRRGMLPDAIERNVKASLGAK